MIKFLCDCVGKADPWTNYSFAQPKWKIDEGRNIFAAHWSQVYMVTIPILRQQLSFGKTARLQVIKGHLREIIL